MSKKWTITGIIGLVAAIITIYTFYDGSDDSNDQITINEAPKSDVEIVVETAMKGVELGNEIRKEIKDNKQRKDSIYQANRMQQWVYQLGEPMDSKEAVLELYKQLEGVNRVSVFKESKKSYFLFVDQDLTEQELKNSLESFKEQVGQAITRVFPIDLMRKCGKKEEVMKTEPLSVRKEEIELDCYVCDR